LFVDVPVPGEGFTTFFVTGERADEVRVFDLLIQVADEATPGKVG